MSHLVRNDCTFLSAFAGDASLAGLADREDGFDLGGLRDRDGISPRSIFWKASA